MLEQCGADPSDDLGVLRQRADRIVIRRRQLLFLRDMKYASRGYSGKCVTILPFDEQQLVRVLDDLGPMLNSQASPYILSHLRWGDGPLYVRYGGFGALLLFPWVM